MARIRVLTLADVLLLLIGSTFLLVMLLLARTLIGMNVCKLDQNARAAPLSSKPCTQDTILEPGQSCFLQFPLSIEPHWPPEWSSKKEDKL